MPKHDVYMFISNGNADTMKKLRDAWRRGQIRYATSTLSGDWGAVAFLEADDGLAGFDTLASNILAVRDAVNPGTSTGHAIKIGTRAPTRWSDKKAIGAYIRIWANGGQARAVFDELNRRWDGNDQFGSALIVGGWDILIEVDADTREEVNAWVEEINGVAGVARTETSLVRNPPTEPPVPESE